MNSKYGNNKPPLQIGRIPRGFYLDNGVPRAVNMILPSPESIDRFFSPIVNSGTFQGIKMLYSDIKAKALFTLTEGFLSPFPTFPEFDYNDLRDVTDFILSYKGGIKNADFNRMVREIQDFISVPHSQIYPEFSNDKSSIKIHCYRNGVYHNQLDYTFDAFTLYLEMYDNQES